MSLRIYKILHPANGGIADLRLCKYKILIGLNQQAPPLAGSKISRKILALSLRILGKSKKRQLKRRWVLRTTRQEVVLRAEAAFQREAARPAVMVEARAVAEEVLRPGAAGAVRPPARCSK